MTTTQEMNNINVIKCEVPNILESNVLNWYEECDNKIII